MIDLQKNFAHDSLAHVNSYTRLSYVDDPEVALIEINNENSLVQDGSPTGNAAFLDHVPEPFRGEVVQMWNKWLQARYHDDSQLMAAWFRKPAHPYAGPADLLNASSIWTLQDRTRAAKLTVAGDGTATAASGFSVLNPVVSSQAWRTQAFVAGLNLVEGQDYALSFRAKADAPRKLPVNAGLSDGDFHYVGLDASPDVGTDWQNYRLTFQASQTAPGHARIDFVFGGYAGQVSLEDVKLTPVDILTGLGDGQSLAAGNIDIPTAGGLNRLRDWEHFLDDVDAAYSSEMRSYLRRDLGVHACIVDTQMKYGTLSSLNREAGSDYADMHDYWELPQFPGKNWDTQNWWIANTPMVTALISGQNGTLGWLAKHRPAGKPYTISEYNEPAPSDYRAEMYPEIATFAAMQDWDGIFEFDYGSYGGNVRGNIQGWFGEASDPAREAFLPAAALLFRTAELPPEGEVSTLHVPPAAMYSGLDEETAWSQAAAEPPLDFLSSQMDTVLDDTVFSPTVRTTGAASPAGSGIQIEKSSSGAIYKAIASASAAAAGFVGGQTVALGDATFTFPAFGDNFAALEVVALDGKSLGVSRHILLTIGGKAENPGMIWNADRTSVGRNWGASPAEAEVIPAQVTLANPNIAHAWALDPTGKRLKEAPLTKSGGNTIFSIGPDYRTVWYELSN